MNTLDIGARLIRRGLILAASTLLLPTTQAATLRIGSVESIAATEISTPRIASGAAIAGRRELRFDAFGRRFDLRLEANPALAEAAAAAGVEALRGEGLGLSGSWVRLTRVDGQWVGLLFDGTEYFAIERAARVAPFNDQARRLPADAPLIYRLRDAHVENASFAGDIVPAGATLEEAVAGAADLPALAATLPDKRLNVGVVLDAEQVTRDAGDANANAIARMNMVDGIFAAQAGVRIAVAAVTALTPGNSPFTKTKPDEALTELREYRAASPAQRSTGLTHLFTGRDLDGSTVGIAYSDSVCNANFAASLSEGRSSLTLESLIAAHEIGHTFNAPHDTESGSACESTPPTFLMAPSLNPAYRTFSDCSLTRITAKVATASCLVTADAPDASVGVPQQANIAVGQATTVGLTVRSNGNTTVQGVRLTATLPAGVQAVGAGATGSGTCDVFPGSVVCVLGDLAAGATRDVEVSLLAAAAGTTQARVSVSATTDSLPGNDAATLRLVAAPGADLGVRVVLDAPGVAQGGTTTARVTLVNNGLSAVSDALLTVTADSGLVPQTPTGTGVSCTSTGGGVTCTPTSLAPGATAELLLPLTAASAGTQRIFLRVKSDALVDPQPGNNEATIAANVAAPVVMPPPAPPPASSGGGGGGRADGWLLLGLAGVLLALRARRHLVPAAAASVGLFAAPSQAEPKPLWELGFGAGALAFSDYRGADSAHVYPLPVPYVIYRGRYLQADRDGVRGILFDQPRASLNLSLNATTPVDSDRNEARAGMPDLDAAIEVGPSLDLHLWRSPTARWAVDFRIPVRASFTLSTDPRFIGWQLAPKLNLDVRDPFGLRDWNLGLQTGPLFADRRYHDYFYRVDPVFATAQRPVYAASAGYAGAQVLASASKRFDRSWFGAFVRYDRLDGATFLASPLVRERSAFAAGFGFAVIFASSAELVDTGP